ncbi:MAG: hypothetical protein WKG07_17495 [Hymenobacter sp.]
MPAWGPIRCSTSARFYTRETKRLTARRPGQATTYLTLTGHGLRIVIHAGAGQDVLRTTSCRRLRYEPEANGTLNIPSPRKEATLRKITNRLKDE